MRYTDACIRPYPGGNSSLARMAMEAREMGFDSVVSLVAPLSSGSPVEVLSGFLIAERSPGEVAAALRRVPRGTEVVMVQAGDSRFNRAVVSMRGVMVLRELWRAPPHAIDHVVARFAAGRGTALDIEIGPLVRGRGTYRQRVLQRYADLLALHRRTGCALTISSGAGSILEQRAVREIVQLCGLFGMERPEVLEALGTIGRMREEKGEAVIAG